MHMATRSIFPHIDILIDVLNVNETSRVPEKQSQCVLHLEFQTNCGI